MAPPSVPPKRRTETPVLVVEDEASIVQLLCTLMKPLDVRLLRARTGTQALEYLASERPALITLDLVLPDYDGFSLLKLIRQRRDLDDVPVLMISAQADLGAQRRAYQIGISDFIAKPFHVDLLDAKLRAWLRLAQKASRMGLLRDLAHEVRSPLTAIGAAAGLLCHEGEIDAAKRQRLSRAIIGEADRLGRMISTYLEGAPTNLIGEAPVTSTPHLVLRDIVEINLPDAAARARVRLHFRGELPEVRVDPDHLRQMVLNLLDNAIAATAERGEVAIEAMVDGQGVALAIWDTGVGIPPEHLPQIFSDGFTTRGQQTRGLGLGITQRLCWQAGGQIQVRSVLGQGTVFTLWLPRSTQRY